MGFVVSVTFKVHVLPAKSRQTHDTRTLILVLTLSYSCYATVIILTFPVFDCHINSPVYFLAATVAFRRQTSEIHESMDAFEGVRANSDRRLMSRVSFKN